MLVPSWPLVFISNHVVTLFRHPLLGSIVGGGFVVLVLFYPLFRISGTSMFVIEFAEDIIQSVKG
jgi:hypothetical protein